jgi:hypothetical protein
MAAEVELIGIDRDTAAHAWILRRCGCRKAYEPE